MASSTKALPVSKGKPGRTLPFDRVSFAKQLEILRAYAAASAQGSKAVSNQEVASIVGLAVETISMCNGFLSSVGFIQRSEGGWIVSSEVQGFFRAFDWNKETASQKLAPLVQASWFHQALMPKLSFRSMEEEDAITELADAATAGPQHRRALKMLIECLESVGVVQRSEGGQLRSKGVSASTEEPSTVRSEPTKEQSTIDPPVSPRPKVATAFSQMAQGAMRFNVSFDVDLTEMAAWRPDRIAAFFSGIAQVLAAKAEVEKAAGS